MGVGGVVEDALSPPFGGVGSGSLATFSSGSEAQSYSVLCDSLFRSIFAAGSHFVCWEKQSGL